MQIMKLYQIMYVKNIALRFKCWKQDISVQKKEKK